MSKTTIKTKNKEYKITAVIGNEVYTAASEDIAEAILSLKPRKISSRVKFTLDYDGKTSSLLKNVLFARKYLTNRFSAMIFGRNLITLLK